MAQPPGEKITFKFRKVVVYVDPIPRTWEVGIWDLGVGSWELGVGSWELGVGFFYKGLIFRYSRVVICNRVEGEIWG